MNWLAVRIGARILWGRLRSAGAWLSTHPLVAICCAMALLCLLSWHEWSVKARQVARLTAEIARFHDAQAQAADIAQEALHHQEAVYLQKAKETDDAYQAQLADARTATDRYIAAHRVRADSAGGPGPAPATAEGQSAQSGNRSGASPDMVAVTAPDIEVCTVNTKRLEAVREWAVSLGQ